MFTSKNAPVQQWAIDPATGDEIIVRTMTPILMDDDLTDEEINHINRVTNHHRGIEQMYPEDDNDITDHTLDQEQQEQDWYTAEAARGNLAGAPHTLPCYECGGFNPNIPQHGITQHRVIALGPILQPLFDPTQSYKLECGHLAF